MTISTDARSQAFIGGEFVEAASGERFDSFALELGADRSSTAVQLAAIAVGRDTPHARAIGLDDEVERWMGKDLLLERRAVLEVPADAPEAVDQALKGSAGRPAGKLEGAAPLPWADQAVRVARRPDRHRSILPRRSSRPSVPSRR
jgi:hypothetical protein